MRGVHPGSSLRSPPDRGSSPHARGPLVDVVGQLVIGRIIPACAGSTAFFEDVCSGKKDHPRMRGVHTKSLYQLIIITGSSPHARGPLFLFCAEHH
jgi:hypothetical protein